MESARECNLAMASRPAIHAGVTSEILIAVVAVVLASFAQGLTGFGFSVVSVPLLLLIFPPQTVVVVALLLSLVLSATLLPSAAGKVEPKRTWPLFAASLAGAALGAALLPLIAGPWLKPAMGFAAFAGGAAVVFARRARPIRRERAALVVTGVVSGAMNALASLSGPAVALLALRQRWEPAKARKTMLAYSCFVNAAALVALVAAHVVARQHLLLAARLLPFIFVGRFAGARGSKRIPAPAMRAVTVCLVLLCGIVSAAQGIAAVAHP